MAAPKTPKTPKYTVLIHPFIVGTYYTVFTESLQTGSILKPIGTAANKKEAAKVIKDHKKENFA